MYCSTCGANRAVFNCYASLLQRRHKICVAVAASASNHPLAFRGRRTFLSQVLRSQTPFLCVCISAFFSYSFSSNRSRCSRKRMMRRDFLKEKLEDVRVTTFVLMSRACASISSAIQAQILQFRFRDSFLCRAVVLLLLLLLFRRRFLVFFLLRFLLWFLLLCLRCIRRRWRG